MRGAIFWAITEWVVVIPCRRFGTTYRSHFHVYIYIYSHSYWQHDYLQAVQTKTKNTILQYFRQDFIMWTKLKAFITSKIFTLITISQQWGKNRTNCTAAYCTSPRFSEPEGSSPHPQVPATCPWANSIQSPQLPPTSWRTIFFFFFP